MNAWLHIQAWASALPSDFDRAMREASDGRMATDTYSYAFLVLTNLTANERKTEACIYVMRLKISLLLSAIVCLVLCGCKDHRGHYEYIALDGIGEDVEFVDSQDTTLHFHLQPLTVLQNAQIDTVGEQVVKFKYGEDRIGLISLDKTRKRFVFYENKWNNEPIRQDFFYEQLENEGSNLSGGIFAYVEQLHFYQEDWNTLLWGILFIVGGMLIGFYVVIYNDEEVELKDIPALSYIVAGIYLFTIFCAFVLFVHQDPFNHSAHSGWGWFADLLIFLGILISAIALYAGFQPAMCSLIPKSRIVFFNAPTMVVLSVVYGICLWLAKGAADYILFAIIACQAVFSLIALIQGFKSGEWIGALIYVLIYPVCFFVLLITMISLGAMVFMIALAIVAVSSVLTQPQSLGNGGATSTSDEILDANGNRHWISSDTGSDTVNTTDGKRMRKMSDGNWKEY